MSRKTTKKKNSGSKGFILVIQTVSSKRYSNFHWQIDKLCKYCTWLYINIKMCFYLKCLKACSDHLAWHFVENFNFWCMVICCIKRLLKEVSFYNFTLQFFLFVTHSNSISSDFHTICFTKKLFYLSRHHIALQIKFCTCLILS